MSLRKHGTGEVILDKEDISAIASTNADWTPEDQDELEAEADKD